MSDPSGLGSALDGDPAGGAPESGTAFPSTPRALLDRLGSLYGLDEELERAIRVVEPLAAVPVEASASLRNGEETTARLTLGFPPRPEDPDGRSGLVAALTGLASERIAATVDEVLAAVAPTTKRPLRERPGAAGAQGRARAGAARCAGRRDDRRRAVDAHRHRDAAGRSGRSGRPPPTVAAALAANPFNAAVPYGLAFDLDAERVLGAKTYFACEWADTAVASLRGRLAEGLGLDGLDGFELLAASAPPERRRDRWLLEVSFELPDDPARGVRAKAYLPSAGLAASEAEGHAALLRLALAMGLEATPYEKLLAAVRPDGLSPERPCSLMAGVSASARGPSLEAYVFNPVSWASLARSAE